MGHRGESPPSATDATEAKHGIHYTVAPELEEFKMPWHEHIKVSERLAHHAPGTKLSGANGSVVYHKNKALLVQRAPTDSMPLKWETPGGAIDDDDSSILDSASRELWEEAGLKAVNFSRLLANWTWDHRRIGLIVKYVFEVEVEQKGENELVVTLDPAEHCAFVWATEEEVRQGKCRDIELVYTDTQVRDSILVGFAHRGNL
jgi:8-oxo-dGTP pyrophosphatase MutT (NUDIX family)